MRVTRMRRSLLAGHQGRVIWLILGALLIVALAGSLLYIFVSNSTQHTPSSPNRGKSVLVLSKPDVDRIANVTLLTMVSTSDGKALWEYHLSGDLAGGLSGTADAQLRAGTAAYIVNGVVYFAEVLDASPDRPALTTFRLMALRADTGARVWQRQMQATTLEILGVSDGVLVAQATTGSNSTVDALTATGYRAETGAVVWERRLAERIGYGGSPDQMFDGILYVRQTGTEQPWAFDALDARTGKPLWRSTRQDIALGQAIAAADGVVILEGGSGVSGVRERDGALLWSHALSPQGAFQERSPYHPFGRTRAGSISPPMFPPRMISRSTRCRSPLERSSGIGKSRLSRRPPISEAAVVASWSWPMGPSMCCTGSRLRLLLLRRRVRSLSRPRGQVMACWAGGRPITQDPVRRQVSLSWMAALRLLW